MKEGDACKECGEGTLMSFKFIPDDRYRTEYIDALKCSWCGEITGDEGIYQRMNCPRISKGQKVLL